MYAQLLPKLNKVIDSFWEVMTYGYDPTSGKSTPDAPRAIAAVKKLEDSLNSWMDVTGISEVFLGVEANAALNEYKQVSSSLTAAVRDSPVTIEYFEQNKQAADKLYQNLIAAAKADLGIVQAAEAGPNNALQPTA